MQDYSIKEDENLFNKRISLRRALTSHKLDKNKFISDTSKMMTRAYHLTVYTLVQSNQRDCL